MYKRARLDNYQHAPNWRSRGYIPHFDQFGAQQFVTYRLADSLPREVLLELSNRVAKRTQAEKRLEIEDFLDKGYGSCLLRRPELATVVEEGLLRFDGERYWMLAWCIMANHVHVLIQLRGEWLLPRVVQSWKRYSARTINELLGGCGSIWFPEYFDRVMRDEDHTRGTIEYIHNNPVKAGICALPEQFAFSSARYGRTELFIAE